MATMSPDPRQLNLKPDLDPEGLDPEGLDPDRLHPDIDQRRLVDLNHLTTSLPQLLEVDRRPDVKLLLGRNQNQPPLIPTRLLVGSELALKHRNQPVEKHLI